jgi:O-succinylbenzoic acid--CoA ligase
VPPATLERVRDAAGARLGAAAAPRRVYLAAELPVRGPGKVDRAAVAALVQAREGDPSNTGRRSAPSSA